MLDDVIFVKTAPLEYEVKCFGYRIEDESTSMAFMTDTLPTNKTIEFSSHVSHFIHEATFTEEYAKLAEEVKHTTSNQAIDLGKKANAKQIYLTHFSPRIEDEEIEELEYKFNFISLHRSQQIKVK